MKNNSKEILQNQDIIIERLKNIELNNKLIIEKLDKLENRNQKESYQNKVLDVFKSYCIRNSSSNATMSVDKMLDKSKEIVNSF